MKKTRCKNIVRLLLSVVLLATLVAFWGGTWMKFYADVILRPFGYKGNWLLVAVYAVMLLFVTSFYGGYQIGYQDENDLFLSSIISLLIVNVVTYFQTCLVARELLSLYPFIIMTLLQVLVAFIWSRIVNLIYTKLYPPHRMLLVYGIKDSARRLIDKMSVYEEQYIIQEVIGFEDEGVYDRIDQFDTVILCDIPSSTRNNMLKYCFEQNKRIYSTPKISDILIRGAMNNDLLDTPILLNRDEILSPEQKVIKRIIDVVLSGIAIIISSPFMLIVALIIKMYDGGPIIYKQTRLTLNGRPFELYKFRSMVVNAEEDGAQLAAEDDHRITPFGKFIRSVRLDELPQLINIFSGDMSIVGPRPERPELIDLYLKDMPEFNYRLKVKAGLTGYAQVYGKYNTTPYDKLKLDLMYIANYSTLMDLKIILMTVKIIFKKESTEGVK